MTLRRLVDSDSAQVRPTDLKPARVQTDESNKGPVCQGYLDILRGVQHLEVGFRDW